MERKQRLRTRAMFRDCTLGTWAMFRDCTLGTRAMFRDCTLGTRAMFRDCTLGTWAMFRDCTKKNATTHKLTHCSFTKPFGRTPSGCTSEVVSNGQITRYYTPDAMINWKITPLI